MHDLSRFGRRVAKEVNEKDYGSLAYGESLESPEGVHAYHRLIAFIQSVCIKKREHPKMHGKASLDTTREVEGAAICIVPSVVGGGEPSPCEIDPNHRLLRDLLASTPILNHQGRPSSQAVEVGVEEDIEVLAPWWGGGLDS